MFYEGIVNEEMLEELAFRPSLPFREKQLKEISLAIKPLISMEKARDIMLVGPPGTGKTASMVYINEKVKGEIKTVYVKCLKNQSVAKIMRTIILALSSHFQIVPETGRAIEFYVDRVREVIKKAEKGILLELDEIDILQRKTKSEVIYHLKNAVEGYPVALAVLTTDRYFTAKFDESMRKIFFPVMIEYERYKDAEIKEILSFLAKNGLLRKGSYSKKLFEYVALNSRGDMRTALKIIEASARKAEAEGRDRIERKDVEEVYEEVFENQMAYKIHYLPEPARAILEVMKEVEKTTSGKLIKEVEKVYGRKMSTSTFNSTIKLLSDAGYLRYRTLSNIGRTREIELKISKKTVERGLRY